MPDNIDFYLADFDYRAIDAAGRLDFAFESPRLAHYPRDDISRIEQPRVDIYRAGEHWRAHARNGSMQHRDNLIHLERDVVLRRQRGALLEMRSDRLRFEPDRDLVASESPVLMRSGASRIEADTATFDLANNIFRFNRARALYQDEPG